MSFPVDNPVSKRWPAVEAKASGTLYQDASIVGRLLSHCYDLGRAISIRPVTQGQVNDTFEVDLMQGGRPNRVIFRKYQAEAVETHIRFEHGLLMELARRGFYLSPKVIPMRNGDTFAQVSGWSEPKSRDVYFAVFTYLSGDNLLNWDRPCCTENELFSAAGTLREYHQAISGWVPEFVEPGKELIDLLPGLAKRWMAFQSHLEPFNHLFQRHVARLLETLEQTWLGLAGHGKDWWPRLAVHGDYHPGNLTFLNGQVAGIFDFDWAHVDYRCLDLAQALAYFCSQWHGPWNGGLDDNKIYSFINGYQTAAADVTGLGPLNQSEMKSFPLLIQAANLHVLDWVLDYHAEAYRGAENGLLYLSHQIDLIDWCRRQSDKLHRIFGCMDS